MCNIKGRILVVLVLLAFLLPLLVWGGGSPFHKAALKGDLEVVSKWLMKKPALLDARNEQGRTALHLAAMKNHKELVALLVKKGADVNLKSEKNKRTALHYAVIGGDPDIVHMLLAGGARVDGREIDGETPLYYAAYHGHMKIVKMLLAKGAAVKGEQTRINTSPLRYAVRQGHTGVAKLLVSSGANVMQKSKTGFTLLHDAAWRSPADSIRFLLDSGIQADTKTDSGRTPLQNAAQGGNVEAAVVLIKKGADVNSRSNDDMTPLYLAVKNGHQKMAGLLLKAGANAEFTHRKDQRSLLHHAAINGHGKVVKMLLAKGADPNAADVNGKTPLHYAARYGHKKAAKLLVMGGAKADKLKKNFGPSPLLKKDLKSGDALVWYLGHSGWAVKTNSYFLVFDYFKSKNRPDEPFLANGSINPEEINGLETVVFASHTHGDHYMPEIFDWRKSDPNITYVMGFEPKDKNDYIYMAPRQTKKIKGLKVTTIKSNDLGVGFFVQVDGLSIFHPGDHANRKNDFSEPFKEEIEFLAKKNLKPDLLFSPLVGCGATDQGSVKKGLYYTVKSLSPGVIFPMHAGGGEHRYYEFAREVREKGLKTPVLAAANSGDYFFISGGKIKYAKQHTAFKAKKEKEKCKKSKTKPSTTL
jgi:ankyrin repeat protein